MSLCRYPDKDNNIAERALRTPVIGRKNFYGSCAQWAAHLAADVLTITATAARHDIEPLSLLTGYLHACAHASGEPPRPAARLDPFLPWTPQGAPAIVPPTIQVPARNPGNPQPGRACPCHSATCRRG